MSENSDFIVHVNHLASRSSYAALARRWGFDESLIRRVAKRRQEPSAHFIEVALAADPYPASMKDPAVTAEPAGSRAAGKGQARSLEVQAYLVFLREAKGVRILRTEQGVECARRIDPVDRYTITESFQGLRETILRALEGHEIRAAVAEVLLPPPTEGPGAEVFESIGELQCLHDFCLSEADNVGSLDDGRVALDLRNFARTCTTSIRQIHQAMAM